MSETRNTFIKVRVTEEERNRFHERAKKLGTTISDLLRQAGLNGHVKVVAIDSEAAFELRRIGAMLKSMYPKHDSRWTSQEKKNYWKTIEALLGFAEQIANRNAG